MEQISMTFNFITVLVSNDYKEGISVVMNHEDAAVLRQFFKN